MARSLRWKKQKVECIPHPALDTQALSTPLCFLFYQANCRKRRWGWTASPCSQKLSAALPCSWIEQPASLQWYLHLALSCAFYVVD